jgi:myo-inositol-1(or 4)-monophosphatase
MQSIAFEMLAAAMASVEEAALELVGAMGREALSLAGREPGQVGSKADAFDLVTSVDKEIESCLRGRIRERFPDHAILGEEQGLDAGTSEWTWVLDPIDGTLNFATGLPIAACSIALLRDDRPRVAAIGDLATNTVFSARAGGGIQSDRPRPTVVPGDLGRARLFVDFSPEAAQPELLEALHIFAEITPVVPRMMGSAAVALLAVAIGGGCFAGVGLRIWDVAAGVLLVEECGRAVRQWDDDQEHVVHVLAGEESSVACFEPAMVELIDLWRALESPGLRATPRTGRG